MCVGGKRVTLLQTFPERREGGESATPWRRTPSRARRGTYPLASSRAGCRRGLGRCPPGRPRCPPGPRRCSWPAYQPRTARVREAGGRPRGARNVPIAPSPACRLAPSSDSARCPGAKGKPNRRPACLKSATGTNGRVGPAPGRHVWKRSGLASFFGRAPRWL